MNSPFIHEQSAAAAAALLEIDIDDGSDRKRLHLAYRRALGREPAPAEEKLSLAFLRSASPGRGSATAAAWAALTRSLFTCVDFQYVP